jgi:hypothetical protein
MEVGSPATNLRASTLPAAQGVLPRVGSISPIRSSPTAPLGRVSPASPLGSATFRSMESAAPLLGGNWASDITTPATSVPEPGTLMLTRLRPGRAGVGCATDTGLVRAAYKESTRGFISTTGGHHDPACRTRIYWCPESRRGGGRGAGGQHAHDPSASLCPRKYHVLVSGELE